MRATDNSIVCSTHKNILNKSKIQETFGLKTYLQTVHANPAISKTKSSGGGASTGGDFPNTPLGDSKLILDELGSISDEDPPA